MTLSAATLEKLNVDIAAYDEITANLLNKGFNEEQCDRSITKAGGIKNLRAIAEHFEILHLRFGFGLEQIEKIAYLPDGSEIIAALIPAFATLVQLDLSSDQIFRIIHRPRGARSIIAAITDDYQIFKDLGLDANLLCKIAACSGGGKNIRAISDAIKGIRIPRQDVIAKVRHLFVPGSVTYCNYLNYNRKYTKNEWLHIFLNFITPTPLNNNADLLHDESVPTITDLIETELKRCKISLRRYATEKATLQAKGFNELQCNQLIIKKNSARAVAKVIDNFSFLSEEFDLDQIVAIAIHGDGLNHLETVINNFPLLKELGLGSQLIVRMVDRTSGAKDIKTLVEAVQELEVYHQDAVVKIRGILLREPAKSNLFLKLSLNQNKDRWLNEFRTSINESANVACVPSIATAIEKDLKRLKISLNRYTTEKSILQAKGFSELQCNKLIIQRNSTKTVVKVIDNFNFLSAEFRLDQIVTIAGRDTGSKHLETLINNFSLLKNLGLSLQLIIHIVDCTAGAQDIQTIVDAINELKVYDQDAVAKVRYILLREPAKNNLFLRLSSNENKNRFIKEFLTCINEPLNLASGSTITTAIANDLKNYKIKLQRYIAEKSTLEANGFNEQQCNNLIIRKDSVHAVMTVIDNFRYLSSHFNHDQIVNIATHVGGAMNVVSVIQAFPVLFYHLRFTTDQIVTVVGRDNGSDKIFAITNNFTLLYELRLNSELIVQMLDCATGIKDIQGLVDVVEQLKALERDAITKVREILLRDPGKSDLFLRLSLSKNKAHWLKEFLRSIHETGNYEKEQKIIRLRELGFSEEHSNKLVARKNNASVIGTVIDNIASLTECFSHEQIVTIANKDGGAKNIQAVIDYLPDLKSLGFDAEQIVKISSCNGGSRNIAVVTENSNKLIEFTKNQIVQIAGHSGGSINIETVIRTYPMLRELGFTNEQIAKIAGKPGGAKNIEAIIENFARLPGLSTDHIVKLAGHGSGASNIMAVAHAYEELRLLGLDSDQIVQIVKHIGGADTITVVKDAFAKLLELGFAADQIVSIIGRKNGTKHIKAITDAANELKTFHQDAFAIVKLVFLPRALKKQLLSRLAENDKFAWLNEFLNRINQDELSELGDVVEPELYTDSLISPKSVMSTASSGENIFSFDIEAIIQQIEHGNISNIAVGTPPPAITPLYQSPRSKTNYTDLIGQEEYCDERDDSYDKVSAGRGKRARRGGPT